ncbi:predicted protein [Naegleria gruberi]|uniref:Predicted protein n=1 Tax=Naegleria gruberi TaxID=5762 RepID=D2VLD8_NAEGR|nr:uncharacterized protein NAEGRDRAFT_69744 [Naegleria gruberi]EFC42291.1 predicted protein [Naegleria gruberi]|eukprot:XP_002675035.1 predicted protein [Naegleria gruberi strain NEG-M]
MSNPLNSFRMGTQSSPTTAQKTNTVNMLSENEQFPVEINTASEIESSTFKSQSEASPTANEQSPSTVSKLKSFFKKRRHSTPNNSTLTTEEPSINNRTSSEQTPTSPAFTFQNDKLSLHVTFKEDHNKQNRIRSSPVPLSTLNAILASNPLDEAFENLQGEKSSPNDNKAKSKKPRHNYSKFSRRKKKHHLNQEGEGMNDTNTLMEPPTT